MVLGTGRPIESYERPEWAIKKIAMTRYYDGILEDVDWRSGWLCQTKSYDDLFHARPVRRTYLPAT